METPYVESDCCFGHEGKEYCAGGAAIVGDRAIVYCDKDMRNVTSWHGEVLGTMRVKSSWRLPLTSWQSDRMYQIEATIGGKVYTGRTLGEGMIARLRLKRGK